MFMGLIFADDNSVEPRTHALVIGIGGYPHLRGGLQERQEVIDKLGSYGQLTSPPRSAIAFANYLIKTSQWLHSPPSQENGPRVPAPLGSLDLLVTQALDDPIHLPSTTNNQPVEGATFDNIHNAYMAWKERGDRNQENVTVFYFCGHGLLNDGSDILLCEDFGSMAGNVYRHSIAFDESRRVFYTCRAKTQLFLVDACRQIPRGELRSRPSVNYLEDPPLDLPEPCEFSLVMKAAAPKQTALGPRKLPSYFIQAMMRALDGEASEPDSDPQSNDWVVRTGTLSDRITTIMRKIKKSEGYSQRCDSNLINSGPFIRYLNPEVKLTISCAPEEANRFARLICQDANENLASMESSAAPWMLKVPPGLYAAESRFDGGEYQPGRRIFSADLSRQPVSVVCQS
jgi:hypothetical protein